MRIQACHQSRGVYATTAYIHTPQHRLTLFSPACNIQILDQSRFRPLPAPSTTYENFRISPSGLFMDVNGIRPTPLTIADTRAGKTAWQVRQNVRGWGAGLLRPDRPALAPAWLRSRPLRTASGVIVRHPCGACDRAPRTAREPISSSSGRYSSSYIGQKTTALAATEFTLGLCERMVSAVGIEPSTY